MHTHTICAVKCWVVKERIRKKKDIKYKVMVHLHPSELRVQIVISGLDA